MTEDVEIGNGPSSAGELASRWCVVANVVEERGFGPGGEETRRGTKHFKAGAKVHIFGTYPGTCEKVAVVGHHRATNEFVSMVVPARHLHSFRPRVVYSPTVIAKIRSFLREERCVPILSEDEARRWAEVLPSWGPPDWGRGPTDQAEDQ